MSEPCEHRRGPRRARRAQAAQGRAYARPARAATTTRRGWFAHRCGVSRCHQVAMAARLSFEETTWRSDD
ncbi:hypothetical protein [Sphaerisporangium sp. TRM90804]|uniref:hypothetical protein n=1 Tax=Sphaerisporangium sp. TRM90804 TaxID=3031113 RepID=UPI002449F921|nr:hypothetical protein [Sphaerisporangium sp. TRM90804]MDH2429933.1 hypothetical protein [Sphaerisporangium sp. TRM90804]